MNQAVLSVLGRPGVMIKYKCKHKKYKNAFKYFGLKKNIQKYISDIIDTGKPLFDLMLIQFFS